MSWRQVSTGWDTVVQYGETEDKENIKLWESKIFVSCGREGSILVNYPEGDILEKY